MTCFAIRRTRIGPNGPYRAAPGVPIDPGVSTLAADLLDLRDTDRASDAMAPYAPVAVDVRLAPDVPSAVDVDVPPGDSQVAAVGPEGGLTCAALSERGASLVEYALLVALLALVAVGAMAVFGGAIDSAVGSGASGLMGP